jgi:galactoside O-acetyltransferase
MDKASFDEQLRRYAESGELNVCTAEFMRAQRRDIARIRRYNRAHTYSLKLKARLLRKIFRSVGANLYIESPFFANWGRNTSWGDDCYANFGLTLVDDGNIYIGNKVLFGPNVTVCTVGHPVHVDIREFNGEWRQFSFPIHIGDYVWVGGHSIILPGVTIGENSVIGAGSVVTRDIPPNVVAVGNPCRVLREITDLDKEFYAKGRRVPPGLRAERRS